jgi:GAF domain-containing protein/signal transduction histidine kinase
MLDVPLLRDGVPIGVLGLGIEQPGGFSETHVALLQIFAEQAVIAITSAETYRALQARTTDLQQSLEYQTATSDVLKVISRSTFGLQAVLDTLVATAARLCGATRGFIATRDEESFRPVATIAASPEAHAFLRGMSIKPGRGTIAGEALLERKAVHVADIAADPAYASAPAVVTPGGDPPRSLLGVPLLRESELVGVMTLARSRVDPFTDRQIELVRTFADQAVIAMENARLLTETREALEQQTATAEVLQVINSSPGDLTPVFDAMLYKAVDLCGAAFGILVTYDGERFHHVAFRNIPAAYVEFMREHPPIYGPASGPGRLALGERLVHILDISDTDAYRSGDVNRRAIADLAGARTIVGVALRKDSTLIGAIFVFRQEVRAFSDKQIALLENFAAQGVIAMENARLINETRQALEQQTAIAQVLQVINSSPGDLAPVFDALLEKAMRLCGAAFGSLYTYDGERLYSAAQRGVPPAYAAYRAEHPQLLAPGGPLAAMLETRQPVHILDMRTHELNRPDYPGVRAMVELGGIRTVLTVPLIKDDALLGMVTIFRQEVHAFSDNQIVLLQNFAAQAVIAMENARLLTEQREALEQQIATAEVLRVISGSPADVQPTFDAIAAAGVKLCDAANGAVFRFDGSLIHFAAQHGLTTAQFDTLQDIFPVTPSRSSITARAILTREVVHAPDLAADPEFTHPSVIEAVGRGSVSVPMLRDGEPIGAITITRPETRSFTGKQISLLKIFADQAVIAIENARLIAEQREALEQQTATAEVLQVINSSPGDLTPVFDAILDKAHTLCGATFGSLRTYDGGFFHTVASRGLPDTFLELLCEPFRPSPNSFEERLVRGDDLVHILDVTPLGPLPDDPLSRTAVETAGLRTMLLLPLRKEAALVGYVASGHSEVRPFSGKQIALLENFAAQAVIAMENARLITETREALEQQTATAEVLQVINSSPGELEPVFDAMLDKALDLCDAAFGNLWTYDGEVFQPAAVRRVPKPYADALSREAATLRPGTRPGTVLGQIAAGSAWAQIPDAAAEEAFRERAVVQLGHARTVAGVALRKDGALLGAITIYRQAVQPFSEKQITLLQNFAAQAVIAMENARLLTEQREALDRQTATAEVLGVINSNAGNLAPVFDAILDKAHALCGAAVGNLAIYKDGYFHTLATHGFPEEVASLMQHPLPPNPNTQALIDGERFRQVEDIRAIEIDPDYLILRAMVQYTDVRTILLVPLRKDGALLGFISANRPEVRPFSEKEIALLENFAAQAVIAMENARLIDEQREALEQQTATAEVLQVINASPGDVAPVFDAMLDKAVRLCDAAFGMLSLFDGTRFHFVATSRGAPMLSPEKGSLVPEPGSALDRMAKGERVVHILDVADTDAYRERIPSRVYAVERLGARTVLWVALHKDNAFVGVFAVYRKEVRAFSDRQIALLENFAAQAVIAMENARLITETREALEQQTATAEVLQVINSSPGNLAPVFETMLQRATRLCGAAVGSFYSYNGEAFQVLASTIGDTGQTIQPGPGVVLWRIAHGESVVQIADVEAEPAYQVGAVGQRRTRLAGTRTALAVALLKDETLVGAITTGRAEVRPFSDKEIALLQNFAAQAVIAMENARLLNEQREALERQTATAEVLGVINANPGNLTPVFDTILEKALALCGAAFGSLYTFDGERFHSAAHRNVPAAYAEYRERNPIKLIPGTGPFSLLQTKRPNQDLDIMSTEGYRTGRANSRAMVELGGIRTIVGVPLLKDDAPVGMITMFRQEVRAFSDRQIALLESFAQQAVIAMENARLLNEVRQRQEELRITFENMGDGVALFDETRHLVASNQQFQDLLDVPDDVISSRPAFADYIRYLAGRGEYGPDPEDHVAHLLTLGSQPAAFERTRPNGRIIEVRGNPVPSGGFVVIYSDITERKRNEQELRAARDAAEEASRTIEAAYRDLKAAQASLIQAEKMASLGQLTAGIAHEIKNPLNFVNNFATLSVDLLDELKQTAAPGFEALDEVRRAEVDDLTSTLASNLEKINEHGRRADGIVRSMLEHSRGSSGERRSVELNSLVDEALNLAYHGARAQDQSFNVTLQRDLAAGMAPITLTPQDITRVLLNLFSNGFYAARTRQSIEVGAGFEPTLRVTTRDLGDTVEIKVRDNGIGIPEEVKGKLFQPFFTTKPTGEGTGLGLSISYEIVTQQHGGGIIVDSEVGEYSEFTVRLPRDP